jgi:hypothetical protein
VLRFDGSDDKMKNSGSPTALSQPFHVFGVVKAVTGSLTRRFWDGGTNLHGALFQSAVVPTGISMSCGTTQGGTGPNYTTTWLKVEMLCNGAASRLRINDVDIALAGSPGTNNLDGFTLADAGGAGGFRGNIDLADLRAYAGELTGDELVKARAYMDTV